MDTNFYLQRYGWTPGHGLNGGKGIQKPILVAHKYDILGLGRKKHNHADAWWERAFDSSLKTLDVSNSATGNVTVTQTQKDGALGLLIQNGSNGVAGTSALYKYFVKGASLAGTVEDGYKKEDLASVDDRKIKKRKRDDDESSANEGVNKESRKSKKKDSDRKHRKSSSKDDETKSKKLSKKRKHDESDDESKKLKSKSRKSSKDKKERKERKSRKTSASTLKLGLILTATTDDSGIEVTPDAESDNQFNKDISTTTSERKRRKTEKARKHKLKTSSSDSVAGPDDKTRKSDKTVKKEKGREQKEREKKEKKEEKKRLKEASS